MKFNDLVEKVESLFANQAELSIVENEMIPYNRRQRKAASSEDKNPRLSAVLCLLYPDERGETKTALILRSTYNGAHSAQISFPGGKKEEFDKGLQETALRESNEEIGVPTKDIKIHGALSNVYIPPSRFLVTPYIGTIDYTPNFATDEREVQQLIEVELSHLLDDSTIEHGSVIVNHTGMKIKTPFFNVHGNKVWGATAIMIFELKHHLLNS